MVLDLILSITTVVKIIAPPTNVCNVGISFKKKYAIIIPNIGGVLLIILAVLALKYFRLLTNNVCPIAVVNKANQITYGYCVVMLAVPIFIKNGISKKDIIATW